MTRGFRLDVRRDVHVRPAARGPRRVGGGFTLLEVMLALAILSITLVGLLGRTTGNVRLTQEVAMRGTVATLARGQMYEIEDQLLREGFQELEVTLEDDFGDQGWPEVRWQAVIEKIELPGLNSLQALQEGAGEGEDSAAGGEQAGGGLLGSFMSMGAGAGAGTGEDTSADASFISSQFELLRQVLEASIRKVTLTITWEVGKEEQTMVVACYFTDPAAMQQVLPGVGGLAGGGGEDESSGGVTPGSGSGSGTGGGSPIPPRNPRVGIPPR